VFAVILAAIFLNEQLNPIALLAGAMIVAGVYISGTPRLRASA
jgi:drug/metabolite transporter (DMT)-like permease